MRCKAACHSRETAGTCWTKNGDALHNQTHVRVTTGCQLRLLTDQWSHWTATQMHRMEREVDDGATFAMVAGARVSSWDLSNNIAGFPNAGQVVL